MVPACEKGTRNWSPNKTGIHMRRLDSHCHKCSWARLEGRPVEGAQAENITEGTPPATMGGKERFNHRI